MVYIKTRSGRFFSVDHIVGFSIEHHIEEIEGRRVEVSVIIAYLPEPLLPAVLASYYKEADAIKALESFIDNLVQKKRGIMEIPTEI